MNISHRIESPQSLFAAEAKPFLKWAGGKTQLLGEFDKRFPAELREGKVENYYEPFLGSGAVFFFIRTHYPQVRNFFLSDINYELISVFQVVQQHLNALIEQLTWLKREYLGSDDREGFYYELRYAYNSVSRSAAPVRDAKDKIRRAAQTIFLNKTCFNGLYRVNGNGKFNVPFGKYKNPGILDEENIVAASNALAGVRIDVEHFRQLGGTVRPKSFVYFDPPYKPISRTSNFTSYSGLTFDDETQVSLAETYRELAGKPEVKLMLSNSDTGDGFFEQLYRGRGIYIGRVLASRAINSKADRRGKINELVITNYPQSPR